MNIRGLQEWIFNNSQEDQWWVSLDNKTLESALTLDEVQAIALSGQYQKIQVLHTSQSNMSNPPWVALEVTENNFPNTMRMNLPALPNVQQGVYNNQNHWPPRKVHELSGIIALIIPLVSSLFIWFSDNPAQVTNSLITLTIISTSFLIGIEATKIGVGSVDKYGRKRTGPAGWVVFLLLLWPIAFPSYMWYRSRYGAKNMLIAAIIISLIFSYFLGLMFDEIDK